MSALVRYIIIATTIVLAVNAAAAERPDSGTLLRESAPPPTLKPQQEPPKIAPPQELKEIAPGGVRVKVAGFSFNGNTVFTNEGLAALVAGYVGKELTFAELNDATAKITTAYRGKGYFLTSATIPPQTVKADKPILIKIVEGVLEGIRLETNPHETRTPHSLIQRYIDRVSTGKPASEKPLTDMVMRINELPGINSRLVLEPGSQGGTTKALMEVREGKPYSVSVDTDNYGTYSTGYYRVGSTLELYSPFHLGDQFTLRAQTSSSGDIQTAQTGYSVPVSGSGTRAGFGYSFVNYELGRSFQSLNAKGTANDFNLTLAQPLIRSRHLSLNGVLGAEAKLLDDRVDSSSLDNKRHTISGQVGINGVEMDNWWGLTGSTSFALNYTGGSVAFDDSAAYTDDQSASGLHTSGGYHKLAMNLARNQSIYKAVSLYTGANGQWASTNLDSAEQFSLGGPNGVRAFPVSEASCDSGLVYTAELRYLIGSLGPVPGSLQLATFLDYGYAMLHDEPIASGNTRNLAGIGIGLTWFDADSFNIRTSVAWRTAGDATGTSESTQPTVYFQAVKRF